MMHVRRSAPTGAMEVWKQQMPTFSFKQTRVADFEAHVGMPFNLRSPFRSTVPLLAYWADAAVRLGNSVTPSDCPFLRTLRLGLSSPSARRRAKETPLIPTS
jgi:hypothetical protein